MAAKATIVPRLVIIEGKDKGKIIPLYDGTSIIGRSKGDVVVQDPRVSRSHIALHYDASSQKLTYTDLKSLNGTLVNGDSSEAGELTDGDKLQLGDTIFDCQIGAIEDEETSVSKVKDRLKRQKDSANKKNLKLTSDKPDKKLDEKPDKKDEPKAAEPHLIPIDDERPEKQKGSAKKQNKKKLSVPIPGVGSIYKKVPRIARVAVLCLVLFGFLVAYYEADNIGDSPISSVELQKSLADINKLISQRRLDDALENAIYLQKEYSDDSRPYMALGNIYALLQKNEAAIGAFTKARDLPPEQPLVHVKLIRVLLRSGFVNEAQTELAEVDRLIKEGKNSKELFIEAAYLFLEFKELKQPPEKALILARALQKQLAPNATIGYKLEAQVLFQRKRNTEALNVLKQGLQIDPRDEWILENMAYAQLSLKDVAGAIQSVQQWIQSYPTTTKALLVMAYLKLNLNDSKGSQPYVERILEIARANPRDPHLPEALYLKGQILAKEKQLKSAAEHFRQSCQAGFKRSCENLAAIEALTTPVKEARVPNSKNNTKNTVKPPAPQ